MKPHLPIHTRDAAGHLDPRYAADLRALGRASTEPKDRAFFGANISRDPMAEELGEAFVRTATGGDEEGDEDTLDEAVPLEIGGLFVETAGEVDLGYDMDPSSAHGARSEPFHKT